MLDFLWYMVCIWVGVGIGVLGTALCVAAREGDDMVRRARNRWWQ